MAEKTLAFADVLGRFVTRADYSSRQLARLSGVPRKTIANWLAGQVQRPRYRLPLLKVAQALHLGEADTDSLLRAAGHAITIKELLVLARNREDKELEEVLSPWAEVIEKQLRETPFQAIVDLPYFVGRKREREEIKAVLHGERRRAICVLQGMAGVGKTTLAARLAYELRPFFPDGVLWARVDLSEPMAILSTFAAAYGRDVGQYDDLDSRSRVVREVLAHKRALVVLDNVASDQGLSYLLPPTTGRCGVIVTTRLSNLSALLGAHWFHIESFEPQKGEAQALFARILGVAYARAEQEAIAELAQLLGHLPLALAIAAGRIASEPHWTVATFVQQLRQRKRPLAELVYGEESVHLSFNTSFILLSPEEQRFFGALGVFIAEDFSPEAAAYVVSVPLEKAHACLRKLHRLSLVQEGRAGRYRLHPLLRDYARENRAIMDYTERMVNFFVQFVEQHQRNYALLALETGNILAALKVAFDYEMHEALVRGTNAFYHFAEVRGLYATIEPHLKRAKQAATLLKDDAGLAAVLLHLGRIALHRGQYGRAVDYLQSGLQLVPDGKPYEIAARLFLGLGTVAWKQGFFDRGESYLESGLALARRGNHLETISRLLGTQGILAAKQGASDRAWVCFQEGLAIAREEAYPEVISGLLTNLGVLAEHREAYDQAESYYQEALEMARKVRYRENISRSLSNLGLIAQKRGDYEQAEAHYREAKTLAQEIGARELINGLFIDLGTVARARGMYSRAEMWCRQGLALAQEMGNQEYKARALYGIAQIEFARGKGARAHRLGQKSLDILIQIGSDSAETAEIKGWLQERF